MGKSVYRITFLCALLVIGIAHQSWAAVSDDDLALVDEEINSIKESRATAAKLGGYVDAEYISDSRSSDVMNANGDKYGFRLHHLSLFVTKKFNDKWKFFSEIEFEDGTFMDSGSFANQGGESFSNTSGSIYAEAVNVDYQWHPSQYARIGRTFTPAGIWSIDHYTPFVPTQEKPMFVDNVFPNVVDGIDLHGTVRMGTTFMDYAAYVANGDGTPGQSDNNDHKALGGRVSFILPMLTHLEVGASIFRNTNDIDNRKTAYGAHAKIKERSFTLQTEYAADTIKPLDGSPETKQVGYYVQALYDISKWTLGYRYDYWDPVKSAVPSATTVDNAFFVNYHVSPVIVCKLETHNVSYDDPAAQDFTRTILSIAYYLGD